MACFGAHIVECCRSAGCFVCFAACFVVRLVV